jgi:glycosyltransferase involved in cell wall biosynthesis
MTRNRDIKKKPIVLIICNYYLPGYKSGGGLRTLVHMVERFQDRFDFRIITRDHDGDEIPYPSVKINDWNLNDKTQVFYLPKNRIKLSKLRELISEVKPQVIYINSVFSTLSIFLLLLNKLKLISNVPIILAPEGELSDGALQLKANKKKAFVKFAKSVGLYKDLIWKVTAEPEKFETERFKGSGGEILVAPNMPSKSVFETYKQELKPEKIVGEAKFIFLSRFMRKKNFKWLTDNLSGIEGKLQIDVYGPLEDEVYWKETEQSIANLPSNIKINYRGYISHEEVLETVFKYHYFVLPTLGENFGHVFIEALAAGCPLLISDRTPWVDLERKQIGWDIPLEKPNEWIKAINGCINLDNVSYTNLSSKARNFATQWLANPKIEESTLKVLQHGLEKTLTKSIQ